jgi:Eukaryotic cytochrome b561
MSPTSTSSKWLYAMLKGSMSSDDTSATISQHSSFGSLSSLDLTKARGGNSANPFIAQAAVAGSSSAGTGTKTGAATATGTASGKHTGASSAASPTSTSSYTSGDSDDDSGEPSVSISTLNHYFSAHGILMSVAILVLFPIGSISMRLLSFRGLVWMHAGIQSIALCVVIAAFGIGIWAAMTMKDSYGEDLWKETHLRLGVVVVALLLLQPFLGLLQHMHYRRHENRSVFSHLHVWLGRALLIMGAVNGGLGLELVGKTVSRKNCEIAYGVIAGVMFVVYVAAFGLSKVMTPKKASLEHEREMSQDVGGPAQKIHTQAS